MPMPLTIRQRLRLDLSRFVGWDYPHAERARALTNRHSNHMSCFLRSVDGTAEDAGQGKQFDSQAVPSIWLFHPRLWSNLI